MLQKVDILEGKKLPVNVAKGYIFRLRKVEILEAKKCR